MSRQLHCFSHLICVLILTLLLSIPSCGGGKSAVLTMGLAATDGFKLQVLEESYLGAVPTGDFTLGIERQTAGLEARISVTGAVGLKACYFQLEYDAAAYDPVGIQPGGALHTLAEDEQGRDEQLLTLEILREPGIVHHGQILVHPDEQAGFTGDGLLATVRFNNQLFTPRTASEPPVTDASKTEANWDATSHTLTWRYACQGDYNQDGYVTINDLTPLGQNYLVEGPFHPDSPLSQVDGNSDGLISINDLTPIGQNFSRFVDGYEVYASFDPGDLPGDNADPPALLPMDFVPFSEHLGNPLASRLMFYREYPSLDPGIIVWVRPVSDDHAGTPSTGQAAMPYDWVINCPSAYSTIETSINHMSLAHIAGLPAILYLDNQEQQLVFQRALDASGMVWSSEVVVDPSANSHFACSMIEVGGQAAVCYHESEAGQVEYTRAGDLTGDAWSEPCVIDTTASGGWDCHLLMVHDHPAVCYADLATAQLFYARAEDPLGESWGAPISVADLGSSTPVLGSWSSLAMIAGHPAIAYYHPGAQELRFIRAADPMGETWESAVVAASGIDVGRYCSLADVHDAPAISYLGDNGLAYARAMDEEGNAWNNHQEVDSHIGAVDQLDTSLALIDGHPAISYYSGQPSADLLFVRAIDPFGEVWEAPQPIDSYNKVGRSSCLLEQEGRPTIAYMDESARQVMYAHSGADISYPPVARLSVYPSPAAVGEDVTLDASLSYAQRDVIEVFEWDLDGDGTYETNSGQESLQISSYPTAGSYLLRVRVTDQHGLSAEDQFSLLVGISGSAPIAVLSADPLDAALGQNIHFSAADSSDDDGTIQLFEWDMEGDGDFEVDTGNVPELDFEYSVEGIFNPGVRITDDSGLADIASKCVNIGVLNARPVAELTASPLQGNPPFLVTLDGSASHDPDGTITTYEWDMNNDGLFEHNGGPTATLQWLCEQYGDQRVRMRVTDNLQAKDTTWMLINSNQAPVALITPSAYNGTAPYDITLDCSGSHDPDGTIAQWGIDLQNDGRHEVVFNGQPTNWLFTNIWNDPTKVRLTVKDNWGATSTAVITVHAAKGWHISTIDPIGFTGMYNSLEIINGQPAIAYFEFLSSSLKYIRATDTYGYNPWAMPVNLGVIAPPGYGTAYGHLSLASVNSAQPAIAFAGALANGSFYAVAKDSQGTSWNPFVTSAKISIHRQPVLGIINQKPVLYYGDYFYGIYQSAAKDSQGFQWNQPALFKNWKYASCSAMTIVNGNPAIAYSLGNSTYTVCELKYCRATQPDGSAWGVPVLIDSTHNPGGAKLTMINGRPAVAYVADVQSSTVGYEVRYKRADDQNGTSWASPAKSVKQDGRTVLGLEEINGSPAIGLVTCQDDNVMYFLANDTVGNSWPSGWVVDDLQKLAKPLIGMGPVGEMIEINDHPAMSYFDVANGDLKYAVFE